MILSPHADGCVDHKGDIQVSGLGDLARILVHRPDSNIDGTGDHSGEHNAGQGKARRAASLKASAEDKIERSQRDQHNAYGQHNKPKCRSICIFGGSRGLGDPVLDGLDIRENVRCRERSVRPVEFAAGQLDRVLHFINVCRVLRGILPDCGIDAEHDNFVELTHLSRFIQSYQRHVEKLGLVVRKEDDDPGPLLLCQFREAEETGRQAFSYRGGTLELVTGCYA